MRRRRLRALPIIFSLVWWGVVAGIILMIDPEVIKNIPVPGSYGLFFASVSLAIWSSAALIWGNYRRAALTTVVVVSFLILRLIKLGNWLNLILLTTVAAVIDSVFTKNANRDT